jgi:hypothetical protein
VINGMKRVGSIESGFGVGVVGHFGADHHVEIATEHPTAGTRPVHGTTSTEDRRYSTYRAGTMVLTDKSIAIVVMALATREASASRFSTSSSRLTDHRWLTVAGIDRRGPNSVVSGSIVAAPAL